MATSIFSLCRRCIRHQVRVPGRTKHLPSSTAGRRFAWIFRITAALHRREAHGVGASAFQSLSAPTLSRYPSWRKSLRLETCRM
jgi:hypothetical protein